MYKYNENSDNSTDNGGSLRSPIIYSENSDNSTDKGGSIYYNRLENGYFSSKL